MTLSMLRLTLRLFLFLIVVLIMAACSQSSDPQPSSVVLTESASGSKVEIKQGQTFSVALKDNLSTGYAWEIVPGSELYLSQQGASQFVSDSSGTTGAGGVRTFTFTAIASGNFTLKLICRQPWMTSVEPAKTFEVAIVVGN